MKRTSRRSRAAFTLMEVLLVLVILVALVSIVAVNLVPTQQSANRNIAKVQAMELVSRVNQYFLDTNQFPPTADGLQALLAPPADLKNPRRWKGPYLDKATAPVDPWDNPYQYMFPGKRNPQKFDIWSVGPDGQDGTEDDVGNWDE